MAQDVNKPDELVEQVEADEAARAAATAARAQKGPSFLGRPWVAAVSLLLLAASATWCYVSLQELFPPQAVSHERRVQNARIILVRALGAVEAYRAERGSYPKAVEETGTLFPAAFGYRQTASGVILATQVDGETVWLSSEDDPGRFLQDGSRVPLTALGPPAKTTP